MVPEACQVLQQTPRAPSPYAIEIRPIARREPLTGTRSDAHVGPEPVRHFHRSNQCLIVVNATSNSSKHSNWCEPLGLTNVCYGDSTNADMVVSVRSLATVLIEIPSDAPDLSPNGA